jgi:hypothetical protein
MEQDDRIVKSVLAAGVLIAIGASDTMKIDDQHRGHVIKSVTEWVRELELALFPSSDPRRKSVAKED